MGAVTGNEMEAPSDTKGSAMAMRSLKDITLAELAKHNTADDLWVAIEGKVYDITEWLNEHPGGRLPLLAVGGKECTNAFLSFHPPRVAVRRLPRYLIGNLVTPPPSPLVEDFARIRKELMDKGFFDSRQNIPYYAKLGVAFFVLAALALYLVLRCKSFGAHMLGAVFLGIFWHQMSFIGHDVGHNSIASNRHVGFWQGVVVNLLYGVSSSWWKRSHNVHHVVTNSIDYDPDIQHLPFFAISSRFFDGVYSLYHYKKLVFDTFAQLFISHQHNLYIPVLCFGRPNLYIQSWLMLLNPKIPVYRRPIEIVSMLMYATWNVWLVSHLPTWTEVTLFVAISHVVCSLVHLQITMSHFGMPAYVGTGYTSDNPDGWFRMQCETTLDVDCPPWLDWLHGGLQFQLEHHLMPRLPRQHLRHVRDNYLLPLMKKHGIKYRILPFFDCVAFVYSRMKDEALKAREYPNKNVDDSVLLSMLMMRG